MYKTWQNPYHMPYHSLPISSLGPKGPLDDIGFSGWYGIWYGFCHVIFSIYILFDWDSNMKLISFSFLFCVFCIVCLRSVFFAQCCMRLYIIQSWIFWFMPVKISSSEISIIKIINFLSPEIESKHFAVLKAFCMFRIYINIYIIWRLPCFEVCRL